MTIKHKLNKPLRNKDASQETLSTWSNWYWQNS
jgi:hypothetical protein